MKPLTRHLVILFFSISLVLPAASIFLPVTLVEIENRRLDTPEVSMARLLEPGFYLEVFRYIRDANPMRVWLIRAGTAVDFHVFDDSPNPREVFKGTDDWLYLRSDVDEACSGTPEAVVENLDAFVARLEQDVSSVVLTVAPSKFIIHPEHLTDHQADLTECARVAGERLRELLEGAEIGTYLDSWELFEREKAAGMQPYFRTDSHFNFEASIPWIEGLVDLIEADIWDPSAVEDLGETNWQGNLMVFIALRQPERAREMVVDRGFAREPVEGETELDVKGYRSESQSVPLIRGETVVVKDSFMNLPESSLAQYLSDVTMIDWRSPEIFAEIEEWVPNADTVILEISEMGIWGLFGDARFFEAYEEGR